MKSTYKMLLLLGASLAISSCASQNGNDSSGLIGSSAPKQRTLFLRPFGAKNTTVDQNGKNGGGYTQNSGSGYVTGDTYRREKMDQAPKIKSQIYAQVPDQILQLPEIHNQNRYTGSTQEVEFRLVPLKDVPATGYHPDPSKSYTADTYVSEGRDSTQPGHMQQDNSPARKFMRIRSGTGEISGMGRKLGISGQEQKKQALAQIRSEEGEQAHYVNGIGWVGVIHQN